MGRGRASAAIVVGVMILSVSTAHGVHADHGDAGTILVLHGPALVFAPGCASWEDVTVTVAEGPARSVATIENVDGPIYCGTVHQVYTGSVAFVLEGDWSRGFAGVSALGSIRIGPYGDGEDIALDVCMFCAVGSGLVMWGSVTDTHAL